MDTDDIAPPPAAVKPPALETMSIEELTERIAELEAEIARIRQVIAGKKASRGEAESVFRI
jgi:uncharacterized small protein (DUF1192 family)